MRGLKQVKLGLGSRGRLVAPHAGAWIETYLDDDEKGITTKSHPTRVRGLKQDLADAGLELGGGRTPRGCVD